VISNLSRGDLNSAEIARTLRQWTEAPVIAVTSQWRALNAPHLVALIRAGAVFVNGRLVERPGEDAPPEAA
jgi:hypothetical protein